MTESDIIGLERGDTFEAPVAGAIFQDTLYIQITDYSTDGRGGEVYPIDGANWHPMGACDSYVVPFRAIFASERWQRYGMHFKVVR